MTMMHHSPRPPLKDVEIIVVGVARNCARTVRREIERLRSAFGAARRTQFLVIESDSSDGTAAELEALSSKIDGFAHSSLGSLAGSIPRRTERIAYCRNEYLSQLLGKRAYAEASYVAVADLDGVNGRLDRHGIASCWGSNIDWDVCTANQEDFYYDVWALRHPQWCPNDCWKTYRSLVAVLGPNQALEVAVHSRMVHLDTPMDLIRVISAFGGLAIYKKPVLLHARYCGLDHDGAAISEHVPLHESISAAGYRIYVNPGLLNASSTHHAWSKKWPARLVRSVFPDLYRPDPEDTRQQTQFYSRLKKIKALLR
jgi:hypothetical protein